MALKEEEVLRSGEEKCDPYSAEKIFGVATLGAIGTLGLYFLYQNLGEEAKKRLKEKVFAGFKAAIRTD